MATKTITIDLEAYGRLRSVGRDTESFSQTIKRIVPTPIDVEAYLERLRAVSLSEEAALGIERHVRGRHRPSAGHCLITRNATHFANIPQLAVETY